MRTHISTFIDILNHVFDCWCWSYICAYVYVRACVCVCVCVLIHTKSAFGPKIVGPKIQCAQGTVKLQPIPKALPTSGANFVVPQVEHIEAVIFAGVRQKGQETKSLR